VHFVHKELHGDHEGGNCFPASPDAISLIVARQMRIGISDMENFYPLIWHPAWGADELLVVTSDYSLVMVSTL